MNRIARSPGIGGAMLLVLAPWSVTYPSGPSSSHSSSPAQAAAPAASQPASLQADLVKDWARIRDIVTKIADAMPEDKYGFKPTPEQRTFGEQMLHVAAANVNYLKLLGAKTEAPAFNMKAAAKAEIVKALGDSYEYGAAVLKEQTDHSLLETVQGPRYMGTATKARIAWAAIEHAWDEYGVVTTYLRLNHIVPPASVRSST